MTFATSPTPPTRDLCIRAPLISWLRAQHADDGSTELLQEFKMPRPSARIDLVVVNGELAGFEIKSDSDTLARLRVQIPAFSRFFDRISIVTTKKHLGEARLRIPDWWGVILHHDGGDFRVIRKGRKNPQIDVPSLLYSLASTEIIELARRAGLPMTKGKKDAMVTSVASATSPDIVRYHARAIIRQRVHTYSSSSPMT